MRRVWRSIALVFFGCLAAAPSARAGDEPPAWLVAAAKVPVPERTDGAPAVEILREGRVHVEPNGVFVRTTRRAIRIVAREGRDAAIVQEVYESGFGSVQDIQAWILRPSGKPVAYGKKHVVDASMVEGGELHTDVRVRGISASNDAEVGSVFGSESVVEYRQAMLQIPWMFQDRWPVLTSRLAVTTPSGWRLRSATFNHATIEPRREGDATVWATSDLSYLEEENWTPPLSSLVPFVAITVVPPAGGQWTQFTDWAAVARWIEGLAEPQSAPTPALTAKARALVEGRTGERERIEAIAGYVQGLHYISVQTGLGRGGGYIPRAAGDVFAKSYGDCKGKANLLRTMLREVGIRAYLVPITSDDPEYVREEWPSPNQFNHCITAISVSDTLRTPAVTEIGQERILLFDPTDPSTPLGQIPILQQGSLALVACGASSALIRVPRSSSAENGLERTVRGTVGPDGALTATVISQSRGREASTRRWEHRSLTPSEFRKKVEAWISESLPGASLSKVEVKDDFRENRFSMEVEVRAPKFARALPGGLFAVKPLNLTAWSWAPRSSERRMPLLLPSVLVLDKTELRIPEGFIVEECTDPVQTEVAFGAFRAACEHDGTTIRIRRELELNRAVLPAGEFAVASQFFDRVRSASQASVVVAPAPPPAPSR